MPSPQPDSISGLDAKNNTVVFGYLIDGNFSNNRSVRQINLNNGATSTYDIYSTTTGLTNLVTGVSLSSSGDIWSVLQTPNSSKNLFKRNTGGVTSSYLVGGTSAVFSDVAADGNLIYIANPSPNQSVIKFDANNPTSPQIFFTGQTPINPAGIGLDSSGNLYVADVISGKVIKYAKADGTRQLEFDGKGINGTGQAFTAIGDVAVDPRNGDIYVIAVAGGAPKIFRYSASGNFIKSFTSSDLVNPDKISINSNGHIYVSDLKSNKGVILAFDAGL